MNCAAPTKTRKNVLYVTICKGHPLWESVIIIRMASAKTDETMQINE